MSDATRTLPPPEGLEGVEGLAGTSLGAAAPVEAKRVTWEAWRVCIWLALGYVGVYLCRKNLSVALPLLADHYHVTKSTLGSIASWGTLAYAVGKFLGGPLTDRLGGRTAYMISLTGVVLFGALGGIVPGLLALTVVYALNRLFGAGAWNAMVKITASWVPPRRLATAIGALSISFVLGGIAAALLAKQLLEWGADWRGVLSLPSLLLVLLLAACFRWVHPGPIQQLPPVDEAPASPVTAANPEAVSASRSRAALLTALLTRPRFLVVCLLSFTLTLMREGFSTWSVDYLVTLQTGERSVPSAALGSIWFDAAGAISILAMGFAYDRLPIRARRWVIFGILVMLAGVLAQLTGVGKSNPGLAVWLLGAVGLLSYGPYSLLAGVFAVECGGEELAGTATGFIDGVGYIAAILSGQVLGQILDKGGYPDAFRFMAILTFCAAVASLALTPPRREPRPTARV